MTNFSGGQCPGECYDEFWDQPIQADTLTVDEILRRYDEMQAQRPYFYLLKARNVVAGEEVLKAKFDDFPTAIKMSTLLHETGNWVVDSIERLQSPITLPTGT